MKDKENKVQFESGVSLFGIEPEMSLQTVNFAPPENTDLSEHYEEGSNEQD